MFILFGHIQYIRYKIAKKHNIPLVVSVQGTMYAWALNQSKYIKEFAMWLFDFFYNEKNKPKLFNNIKDLI